MPIKFSQLGRLARRAPLSLLGTPGQRSGVSAPSRRARLNPETPACRLAGVVAATLAASLARRIAGLSSTSRSGSLALLVSVFCADGRAWLGAASRFRTVAVFRSGSRAVPGSVSRGTVALLASAFCAGRSAIPALGAIALSLSACAPKLPPIDTATRVSAYLPHQQIAATPQPAAWWQIFANPQLNALVAAGLSANPTIDEAAQNLTAAQANAAAANGAFRPQILLNPPGGSTASRSSYPTGPNGYPPYTIYSLTGSFSYDPGLFGAKKYTAANGQALAAYQAAEFEAARQTVAQNIVAATITLAGANEQIATTAKIIAAEGRLLTLLQGEFADGAIPELNVLQQQSVILATQATLPPLQTTADQQRDRLAILTGQLPADFSSPDIALASLALPSTIPVALPSAYLADRPDLRAALAQVAAQNAALGVAVAHLYPDLTLSASGGYAAETLGTLFGTDSALWTLAGNLLLPIYQGGELHAHKTAAQAQLQSALFAYREAVLTAFAQAADALQAVQNDQTALDRAKDAAATAYAAYHLGSQQFSLGAIDYTTVLNAQAVAAQQALIMVQARTNLLLDIGTLQAVMAK
jgi:NodT family efflux transporter outer membrane factor (OMF) lipoprotein